MDLPVVAIVEQILTVIKAEHWVTLKTDREVDSVLYGTFVPEQLCLKTRVKDHLDGWDQEGFVRSVTVWAPSPQGFKMRVWQLNDDIKSIEQSLPSWLYLIVKNLYWRTVGGPQSALRWTITEPEEES